MRRKFEGASWDSIVVEAPKVTCNHRNNEFRLSMSTIEASLNLSALMIWRTECGLQYMLDGGRMQVTRSPTRGTSWSGTKSDIVQSSELKYSK
jgi:hypothetical protein